MRKSPVELVILTIGIVMLTIFQMVGIIYSIYLLSTSSKFVEFAGSVSSNAILELGLESKAYISLCMSLALCISAILLLRPKNIFRVTFVGLFTALSLLDYLLTGSIFYLVIKSIFIFIFVVVLFNPRTNRFYKII